MNVPDILDNIEPAITEALADPARVGTSPFNEDELRAFRLGFLAGCRYGIDVASKEFMSIGKPA